MSPAKGVPEVSHHQPCGSGLLVRLLLQHSGLVLTQALVQLAVSIVVHALLCFALHCFAEPGLHRGVFYQDTFSGEQLS